MFSGWTNGEPAFKSERDAEQNNILIESATSNFAQWDVDKPHFTEMLEQVKLVHGPEEF